MRQYTFNTQPAYYQQERSLSFDTRLLWFSHLFSNKREKCPKIKWDEVLKKLSSGNEIAKKNKMVPMEDRPTWIMSAWSRLVLLKISLLYLQFYHWWVLVVHTMVISPPQVLRPGRSSSQVTLVLDDSRLWQNHYLIVWSLVSWNG